MTKRSMVIRVFLTVLFLFGIGSSLHAQSRPRPRRPMQNQQQEVLYLTQEQEEAVIQYLKEVRPEQSERLLQIRENRPAVYRTFLSRAYREMRYMDEMKKTDPERYRIVEQEKQLESRSQEIAVQYRESTDESEKDRLRAELSDVLDRLFDLRQLNREFEIERLERRLAEAKENNTKRLENKQAIIEQRLNELLKEKAMAW